MASTSPVMAGSDSDRGGEFRSSDDIALSGR
jgi:hypothetical protein